MIWIACVCRRIGNPSRYPSRGCPAKREALRTIRRLFDARLDARLSIHDSIAALSAGALLVGCAVPDLPTDLRKDGPPNVTTVTVMSDLRTGVDPGFPQGPLDLSRLIETATHCRINDEKRPGLVGLPTQKTTQVCPDDLGMPSPAEGSAEAAPPNWFVRVVFDKLLDPKRGRSGPAAGREHEADRCHAGHPRQHAAGHADVQRHRCPLRRVLRTERQPRQLAARSGAVRPAAQRGVRTDGRNLRDRHQGHRPQQEGRIGPGRPAFVHLQDRADEAAVLGPRPVRRRSRQDHGRSRDAGQVLLDGGVHDDA